MSQRLAYALLPLTLTLTACASGFHPSPHYANVTKHLDVGGDVLLYADVEGDLAAGADYLDKLIQRSSKTLPDLKLERVQAKRILHQLGLDQILALGLSSSRDGKAFHNKSFLRYGNDRRGLLLFSGAPPRELEVARQAPGDADVAFESDLKIKSLVDLVETIATDIAGKEAKDLFAGLDEKLPGSSLSLRQLIGHLDTRLVAVLRVDERRAFVWPGDGKTTIPGFDLLLSADGLAVLFDAYEGVLRNVPDMKVSVESDMHWIEFDLGMPGAAWLKPVLAKNAKSGRLFLATSKSFVQEFLGDKTAAQTELAQAPDFKRATARFMSKANALTYMSGAFMPKVARFVKPLGKESEKLQAAVDSFLDLLPEGGIPFAAQQVNLADGLYHASYATMSHKSTLFPALVAMPLVVAGAAAAVLTSGYRGALGGLTDGKKPVHGLAPEELGVDEEDIAAEIARHERGDIERFRIPLGGPSRGADNPTVSIVEFADFQCPFSGRVAPTLRQLLEHYPNDVRVYFHHLPLAFHHDAPLAAQAAKAAEAQGKFWPMHDALFANQRQLGRKDLESYARKIELDVERFKADLDKGTYKKAVDDEVALAGQLGAARTPTFYINGRLFDGVQPLDAFKKVVDEEIARAKQVMGAGTPRAELYAKLTTEASKPVPVQRQANWEPALSQDVYKVAVGRAPARGGKAPKVTIVEFADFQCPFSARERATLDELAAVYGDDLRLVFKHHPLSFHARAMAAALAAEAARAQGKFWAMHDKLFANQQHLAEADLERYAREIGLDLRRYRAALKRSAPLRRRIEADQAEAERFGAAGTPNFFVNGRPLRGAYPVPAFETLIEEEIRKADENLRQGKARKNLYAELTKGGLPRVAEAKPEAGRPDPAKTYRAEVAGAPVRGAKDALLTIVQFGGYQCPFTHQVEPTLARILGEYKGEVRLAWRDMPLPFHPQAKDAAIAARAAGEQGKYWEMHDKLLGGGEGAAQLDKAGLEKHADELGLDVNAFNAATERAELAKSVDADAAVGAKLGVVGTPAFFINGKFLSGSQSFEVWKKKIDEELKAARKLVAKGTPKAKVYAVIMRSARGEVEKPAP
jgi:protein-disulfide isomerase